VAGYNEKATGSLSAKMRGMSVELRLANGSTVTIKQLPGHYNDKEIDFSLDGQFVGGNHRYYSDALANAIEGVEARLGQKVLEYRDGDDWIPWVPKSP
jgi:hypothetical protein